jgi:hypothetical protein
MTRGQFKRLIDRFGYTSFPELAELVGEYEKLVRRFGEDKVIAVFAELAAITPLVNDIVRQTLEVSRLVMEQLPPPPSRRKRGGGPPKGNYRQALVEMAELLANGQAKSANAAAGRIAPMTSKQRKGVSASVSPRTLINDFEENLDSCVSIVTLKILATKDPDLFRSAHDKAVKDFLDTGTWFPDEVEVFKRVMQISPEWRAEADPTASIMARLIDETAAEVRRKMAKIEKTRPS